MKLIVVLICSLFPLSTALLWGEANYGKLRTFRGPITIWQSLRAYDSCQLIWTQTGKKGIICEHATVTKVPNGTLVEKIGEEIKHPDTYLPFLMIRLLDGSGRYGYVEAELYEAR